MHDIRNNMILNTTICNYDCVNQINKEKITERSLWTTDITPNSKPDFYPTVFKNLRTAVRAIYASNKADKWKLIEKNRYGYLFADSVGNKMKYLVWKVEVV